jgi:hypothetical protein
MEDRRDLGEVRGYWGETAVVGGEIGEVRGYWGETAVVGGEIGT